MKSDLNASDRTFSSSAPERPDQTAVTLEREGWAIENTTAAQDLICELLQNWFSQHAEEETPVEVRWHDDHGRSRRQLALSVTRVAGVAAPSGDDAGVDGDGTPRSGPMSYTHELVATLAHDLNNLLTPIVAISTGLEQDLDDQHPSHEQLRDLRIAAEQATLFVQRTLSSLRLRVESAVHIGNVVRDLHELLRLVAGGRITLEVDVAPRTGLARLDRNRLESGLLDLVSNARDAIPERGTVTLRVSSVELTREQAERLGRAPGTYELVVIEDTGTGIRQDLRERIFERHFTTKRGRKGHGLGLAHVRRFVEESGGAISVESSPGERTRFSLFFPRMRSERPR